LNISLSADAVGSAEIANDAVGSTEIAAGAVGSSEIADASVANGDLVNDGITIGNVDASLGGTYTTLTGLVSVTSTGFTGNLSGNVTGNLTGQVLTASQTSITTMANLTTVGTIGTGTWQGTAVADTYVADDLTINAGDIDNTPIDGSTIGATTAAAADVSVLTVEDNTVMNENRNSGIVLEVYDENLGTALTVNATTGVFINDLTLNDSFTLTGAMSATTYTTTAGDPTNDNHLARKAYVDAQIAAEVGAVDAYDYAATASNITNTGGSSLTYYLNGALLLYEDHTAGDQLNANKGYTITVYGDGFAAGQTAVLWCRGTQTDLVTGNNWAAAVDGNSATFTVTYNQLVASAGGSQTDGVVRCHLVVDGKNTGLSFKFHLDSTSAAATTTSFN
jgi:hypothetical protein